MSSPGYHIHDVITVYTQVYGKRSLVLLINALLPKPVCMLLGIRISWKPILMSCHLRVYLYHVIISLILQSCWDNFISQTVPGSSLRQRVYVNTKRYLSFALNGNS